MKVFKLLSVIKHIQKMDDDSLRITGYASTKAKDRVGDVILPEAWTKGGLDNYKKNPIILYNHNYNNPIGKTEDIEVNEEGLKITSVISPHAGQAYGLVKDGVLTTFSVGFMIRDADYDKDNEGFIVKDAELLEVSVVSVPCNQDACFSVAKSMRSEEELKAFKKELHIDEAGKAAETDVSKADETARGQGATEKSKMDPEELKRLAEEAAQKRFQEMLEEQKAAEKAAAEKALQTNEVKEAAKEAAKSAAEVATKSAEERLLAEFEKRIKEKDESFEKAFGELKNEFSEKAEEFAKMRESKRQFKDRGGSNADVLKTFETDIEDAYLLGRVLGNKGNAVYETDFAKQLIEKVNTHSTVEVSSADFEQIVSTNVERDIQNELVVAPLFREVAMNSATLILPVMPDTGHAEITANQAASGTSPHGNMDMRSAAYGDNAGITMAEVTLSTIKMIAKSYLGNETEEDAILPILPLIRESMIRAHARGVDNLILAGNDADGVYTSNAKDGLLKLSRTQSRLLTAAGTATPLTAAALFSMRKAMGKYGVRPEDVVYIVSQTAYFELIEDAEFQDADLVGNQATKLTGEIGRVYGSRVLMSDEFAAAGAGKIHAVAVNRRNFVVPRLRGITAESEYQVENQRRVLVTSQRLGFNEIIANAKSVIALRYAP